MNAACECHGEGALQAAVRGRNPFCLIELIRAGADVNHKNNTGRTALMFVSDSGCLEELIEAGADVNIKDDYKFTPLMYAAEKGNAEIVNVSPKNKQTAHNPNRSETKSTHACFTKRAKCMTLSVLETSLPMQRSHDTLAFGI